MKTIKLIYERFQILQSIDSILLVSVGVTDLSVSVVKRYELILALQTCKKARMFSLTEFLTINKL